VILGVDITVSHGDTLTVTYVDTDDGEGHSNVPKTASAAIDCAGPEISNLVATDIGADSAVITWDTDEPANSFVRTTPGDHVAGSDALVTEHALLVTGLDQCTGYTVKVYSMDALGNLANAGPSDPFQTLQETVALADDVESGNIGWTAQGTWTISSEASHSPANAWSDSPGGEYANNLNISLTSPVIDLTNLAFPELRFFHTYDLESGYDYGYLEVSSNGSSWTGLATYNGTASAWTEEVLDLSAYAGSATFQVRFRLDTDGYVTEDGWHIDDVEISAMGECPLFADDFESGNCSAWSFEVNGL
jgi:hypothetical protein